MQKIKKIFGYIIGISLLAFWIYSMFFADLKPRENPNFGDDAEYFIDR